VPPELDAIVLRALAKDPEQRFADADEFIAALTAARELIRSQAPGQTAEFAPADGGVAYEAPAYQGYEEPAYAQEVYETYEPPPRERRVWPWVLAALLVAAAIAAGVYLALGASKARVPNVVGEQQAPATTLLEKAGFTPVPLQATSTAPQGMVLAQSPAAGAKASKNSIVQITVSSGPGTTTVPDLGNRTEAAARSILIRRGFQVHVTRTPSADVAAGHVITTSPPAFSQAQKGSAITLQVSSGPQQVSVPDVVGQTQDNAAAILEAQGFKVVRTAQPSNQTAGTVISQTPAGNANAPMGSVVTLTVAKPAVQATVPSLVGQSGFAAAGALAAAGLRAATSYRAVTNPAQDGIVLRQSPRAGTKVRKGATVHLVLGRLTVPSGPTGTTSPVGATGAT
jgi:serine/threonine-protein kinase